MTFAFTEHLAFPTKRRGRILHRPPPAGKRASHRALGVGIGV
jgi:hypothetical protein